MTPLLENRMQMRNTLAPGSQPVAVSFEARNADIRRRRALPPGKRPSLQALADEHHISRERIRQIADGPRFDGRNGRLTLRLDGDVAVILITEGEGRYEARFRSPESRGEFRVGTVLGGRRRWVFEAPGGVNLRGNALKQIAGTIGEWAAEQFSVRQQETN